jgi:hypothetical protein
MHARPAWSLGVAIFSFDALPCLPWIKVTGSDSLNNECRDVEVPLIGSIRQ